MNKLTAFKKLRGSLSVFITTILIPLILIFSMVCESARLGSQKAMYASALYLSSYSVLASYCKELYEDYGIFALQADEEMITDDCSLYLIKNLLMDSDLSDLYSSFYRPDSFSFYVDDITYLTDEDGRLFAKSAINYSIDTLLADTTDFVISTFQSNCSSIGASGTLPVDINDLDLSSMEEEAVADMTESVDNSGTNYMDIIKNSVASEETLSLTYEDILDFTKTLLSTTLLSIVTPNPTKLSKLAVEKVYLPSEDMELSATATEEYASFNEYTPTKNTNFISDNLDKTFFIRYLSEHFTCYTDYSEDNDSLDYPLLYQLEYILCGEETDLYNLFSTAVALVITRAQLNFAYIITDSEKVSDAKSVAEAAFAEFAIPGLVELATFVILIAWSVAEGVVDCRDLMSSKKVPIIKTKASWTLSLENIGQLSSISSKNKGDTGLTYKDYLLCLLMLQNNTDTYFKTMDVIQVCMEHRYDTYFRIKDCVYGFSGTLSTENPHVFNYLGILFSSGSYSLETPITIAY